jgi:hypothetical protein
MDASHVCILATRAIRRCLSSVSKKIPRFLWRTARNLVCATGWGQRIVTPPERLASRFGPDDAAYGIRVFLQHYEALEGAGFRAADRILEVGPGRNLGTALLMWAINRSRSRDGDVTVILWDVFPNLVLDSGTIRKTAVSLLQSEAFETVVAKFPNEQLAGTLREVSLGIANPDIRYRLQPLSKLASGGEADNLSLVYSQAAIEHVWEISAFWQTIIGLTKVGGWHSHRIDLADHGRRETNYVEMLEWSPTTYWLMMRFVPGAINRWRASTHLKFVARSGLRILRSNRETRDRLPIERHELHRSFRDLDDVDLRTTAIDIIGVKVE